MVFQARPGEAPTVAQIHQLDNGRSSDLPEFHLHGLPGNFSRKSSKRLTWGRKRSCAIGIALGWIHVAAIIKSKLTANNIAFLRAYVLSMMLSITIYNFARGDWPCSGNCKTGEWAGKGKRHSDCSPGDESVTMCDEEGPRAGAVRK